MKKYINLLLIGFLIFIIGLIIINFELNKFEFVSKMPDNFNVITEKISVKLDRNKEYELKKSKYNESINIETVIDNSLKDEILI